MTYHPCFHGCQGECIVDRRRACSVVCHPACDYVPPDLDTPIGRYLANIEILQNRERARLIKEQTGEDVVLPRRYVSTKRESR